jgi:hypothetical protein
VNPLDAKRRIGTRKLISRFLSALERPLRPNRRR